jgi:hypothetical protein
MEKKRVICYLPMKALGIVILSHSLSRTSSPESALAMALTTEGMSMRTDNCRSSKGPASKTLPLLIHTANLIFSSMIRYGIRYLLWSQSGMLEVIEELVEVNVLTEGGLNGKSPKSGE